LKVSQKIEPKYNINEDEKILNILLEFGIKFKHERRIAAEINVIYVVSYKYKEELEEAYLRNLIGNGILNTAPFVRKSVASITAEMGWEPYILPSEIIKPRPICD